MAAPFLDVEAVDLLALGARLVGHQHAAEHLLGVAADLGDGLDDADAALGVGAKALEAALAAAAGVDLALHDEDRRAERLGGLLGFFRGEGGKAAGNGDAEFGQYGLGLMLVDIHRAIGSRGCR
jgi:hypothetical protein